MWLLAWCLSLGTWKVPDSICQPGLDLSAKWVSSGELGLLLTNANSEDAMTHLNTGCPENGVALALKPVTSSVRHGTTQNASSTESQPCFLLRGSGEVSSRSVPRLSAAASCTPSLQRTGIIKFESLTLVWKSLTLGLLWKVSGWSVWVLGRLFFKLRNKRCFFSSEPCLIFKPWINVQNTSPSTSTGTKVMGMDVQETKLKNKLKCLLVSQCW